MCGKCEKKKKMALLISIEPQFNLQSVAPKMLLVELQERNFRDRQISQMMLALQQLALVLKARLLKCSNFFFFF